MLGRTDHRSRLALLMVGLIVFATAAAVRLADWQVARGPELRVRALAQLQRPTDVPTLRGRILDRNGRVLALTGYRDLLAAYPKLLVGSTPEDTEERRAAVLEALTGILDLSRAARTELKEKLDDGKSEYIVIAHELTEEQSAAVRQAIGEGKLRAVGLEPQPVRMYPNPGGAPGTTLASHLLGFVSRNGAGNYGIEQQYHAQLAGRPTKVAALRDPYNRLLGSSAQVLEPGVDGADIRLTIDAGLQLQLEKELYAAWVTDKAKRVSGLIMDPETGAILAWASVPGYNANNYAAELQRNPGVFQDPIVSHAYEPGSVMKMFTAAAALDNRTVTLTKPVRDSASLRFSPYTVRNADHRAMGWIPFRDVIAFSRNVATARTASNLGKNVPRASTVLYRMWTRLGIGRRTGVDLAGESVGIARNPATSAWAPIDLANASFGQGVSVTQVQLAAGYTPMINGGFRVTPHFLGAIGDQPHTPAKRERVLNAAIAGQLHSILDRVTAGVPWYAEGSLIPGYQVGGKTGTAQIWMPARGRYSRDVFNFSYIGYVGGDKPEAVVAVRIEEARVTSKYQGAIEINLTSYQLGRRIAMDIIETLDIPRSKDPGAGFPEPLSMADEQLTPGRYADHLKLKKKGVDLQAQVLARYQPRADRSGDRERNPEGNPRKGRSTTDPSTPDPSATPGG